jgi:antitoxin component of MazEF toxin-antitoxin module
MKSLYAIQPYEVGSKDGKSLALIIPAKVAKQCNVDTSTVFTLRVDEDRKRITLQTFNEIIMDNCRDSISRKTTAVDAGQRFEASAQQKILPQQQPQLSRESNK